MTRIPNHFGPDAFLNLEEATAVTRQDVASAWELTYELMERRLVEVGSGATLYVVVGLQGAGKSTWISRNAARMGEQAVFLEGPLPSRRHRERAVGIATQIGCRAVAVWINTPLDLAKSRNEMRRGLARIRDEAIMHVFQNLEPPTIEEGFADVIEVRANT